MGNPGVLANLDDKPLPAATRWCRFEGDGSVRVSVFLTDDNDPERPLSAAEVIVQADVMELTAIKRTVVTGFAFDLRTANELAIPQYISREIRL